MELLQKIVQQIGEEIENRFRSVLMEFGLSPKAGDNKKKATGWLSIEDAKKIVPIKSKKKWKQIRDECRVNFARVGKGYIYEVESLHNYIVEHSTITKAKGNGKGRK